MSSGIKVEWFESTPAEESIQVAHRPVGGTYATTTLPPNSTSWVHTGVTAGTVYQYKVRACDSAGCSDWSPEVTGTGSFRKLTVTNTAGKVVTSRRYQLRAGRLRLFAMTTGTSCLQAWPYRDIHAGHEFVLDHWEGDCSGSGCTVTMNGDRSAHAVYKEVDLPGPPVPPGGEEQYH